MITERTLRKWRAEALEDVDTPDWGTASAKGIKDQAVRILRMTQELLDQHLLNKTQARGMAAAKRKFDTLAPSTKGTEDGPRTPNLDDN